MSQCPKCGNMLGCSCSLRSARDGTRGCVQCIPPYEQQQDILAQQRNTLQEQARAVIQSMNSTLLSGPQ